MRWFKRWRWCQQLTEQCLWALLIDIDHFKHINDRFGHSAGNVILKNLAALLQQQSRSQDLLVCMGGEEFLVLITAETTDDALQITERIHNTFQVKASLWRKRMSLPFRCVLGVTEILEHKHWAYN